jgi:hypothetical protein
MTGGPRVSATAGGGGALRGPAGLRAGPRDEGAGAVFGDFGLKRKRARIEGKDKEEKKRIFLILKSNNK